MDQSDAVNDAVLDELQAEHRPIGDLTAIMGTGLNYIPQTMDDFLDAVKDRLDGDDFTFTYDLPFVQTALGYAIAELIDQIDQRTA